MSREPVYGHCVVCGEYTKIPAKGMCWKHYARQRRHGNVDDPEYINTKPCSVPGCEETARSEGMCHRHFMRYERYGDPSITKKRSKYDPPKTCVVKGCNEEQKSHDLCNKHYHNFMYHVKRNNIPKNVYDYLKLKEANE